MSVFLGIDLGSTSITVSALEVQDDGARVIASFSIPNDAETTSPTDRLIGRSEWDIEQMVRRVAESTHALLELSNIGDVAAIGVTGQQQGCQLLDSDGLPLGPFISWQDQRAKDSLPDGEGTYLDAIAQEGGAVRRGKGLPSFPDAGCPIVTGYTAPTLFWLQANDMLHPDAVAAITAPEYLVHRLVGAKRPVTDATDAAGWGIFHVPDRRWNYELVSELGIEPSILPDLRDSCTLAGSLCVEIAEMMDLPRGTPVAVASGDHQCSFVGAAASQLETVAVNIGTGGQATVYVDDLSTFKIDADTGSFDHGWLELRPHIENGYLLAGVGIVGGRTFRTLKEFFVRTASDVYELSDIDDDDVYSRLTALAGKAWAEEDALGSAEVVSASVLFTGSREVPADRGRFWGITPGNFTPGGLTLALFRSMASELGKSYRSAIQLGAGDRKRLVGSGSGLRKNDVLKRCIEEEFGMDVAFGSSDEEAAVGAALCAAVAVGVYPNIDAASRVAV